MAYRYVEGCVTFVLTLGWLHPEDKSHVFADASKRAYGCFSEAGSSLPLRKAKVAPLKPLSLPRLELQADYLAACRVKEVLTCLRVPVDQILMGQAFK